MATLIFSETFILFSLVATPIYIPNYSVGGSLFSIPSLAFVICKLFYWWLYWPKWGVYTIVVSICRSLIISSVEHLLICVLAICMSSLEKCLFRSPNAYLGEMPISWLVGWFVSVIELYELFIYFRSKKPLSSHLQESVNDAVCRSSFHFVYGFLCCADEVCFLFFSLETP